MRRLSVHLLPSLVAPESLAESTAVVIDVLRATTTAVCALAHGARAVVPCLEVDEARQRAAILGSNVLLGGERGGRAIAGFDLGNSPTEYLPDVVRGKTIVFTTTNGTRALERCRHARRILLGAFVNYSALCDALRGETAIDLVCAGTDQHVTREDVLFAGAVVDDLLQKGEPIELNDQALLAVDAWRGACEAFRQPGALAERLRHSRGGKNLLEIGQERDIDIAAEIDRHTIVPQLDREMWEIRASLER